MSKDLTATNQTLEILPIDRAEYKAIKVKDVLEIVEKAKAVEKTKAGLPSSDSIEYYPIDEKLKEGEKEKLTYLATTVENRIDPETAEMVMLPVAIVIDKDGNFWKNAAFSFVRHFAGQQSGYQAEMTFKGYRKTKTGNKMQRLEFRPLA
jgi:hypothetical protein